MRLVLFWLFTLATLVLYYTSGFLEWQEFMNENPRRHHWVGQFIQAHRDTGELLLFKPPGSDYVPMESLGDDPGIYLAFTALDSLGLGLSNLHMYWLLCATPAILYLLVLWPLTAGVESPKTARALIVLSTFLALTTLDVYVFVVLPSALFINLLVRYERFSERGLTLYILLFALICAGIEQVRSNTGSVFFLVAMIYTVARNRNWRNPVLAVVAYLLLSFLYSHHVEQLREARNAWLTDYYQQPVSRFFEGEALTSHAVWYNIFLGLGYDQIDGVRYHDSFAGMTLKRKMHGQPIVGGFYPLDTEAERTLKERYLHAVKTYPLAVFWMYLKKLAVCLAPVLIFSGLLLKENLGLAKFREQNGQGLKRALILGVSLILMAPGVLAWPHLIFFLGAVVTPPGLLLLDRTKLGEQESPESPEELGGQLLTTKK